MAFLQGSLMAWRVDALLMPERAPPSALNRTTRYNPATTKISSPCNCVRSIILRTRPCRTQSKPCWVEKSSTIEIPPQSAGLFVLATFNDNQTFPLVIEGEEMRNVYTFAGLMALAFSLTTAAQTSSTESKQQASPDQSQTDSAGKYASGPGW